MLASVHATFVCGERQERVFEKFEAALIGRTFMAHARPGLPYVTGYDAAMQGLAAMLF